MCIMPMGRPTIFTSELATEFCERIASGKSVRAVCRADDMPEPITIRAWLREKEDFSAQYARAVEHRADAIFDEMFDIADDGTNDYRQRTTQDGEVVDVLDYDHVQRSKLRIDTRKWALARMAPRKYGDRVVNEHVGPGGGPLVTVTGEMSAKDAADAYRRLVEGGEK